MLRLGDMPKGYTYNYIHLSVDGYQNDDTGEVEEEEGEHDLARGYT